MRQSVHTALIVLVSLILTAPGFGLAHDRSSSDEQTEKPTKDSATWNTTTVDDTRWVGPHVSVAIDPITGKTFIAYYESDDDDLWLAREVGSGGNCGPNDSFQCTVVDSEGDVGQYNSIDVHTDSYGTKAHISYHNADAGSLKYARVNILPSGVVFIQVRTIRPGLLGVVRGRHTSLKLDSNHTPYIASQADVALGDEALVLATHVGDGSGNCGVGDISGDWQCDIVYEAEDTAQHTSLAFSSTGKPRIAFYDEMSGAPKIAIFNGSMWLISTVSRPGKNCGKFVSFYIGDDGAQHIAYFNDTDDTLEYARPQTNGNCGSGSWQCNVIDDVGPFVKDLAIAGDPSGYPMIAYQDTTTDTELKLARPRAAVGSLIGNCGPGIPPMLSWQCTTVEHNQPGRWIASSVALAIGPTGGATIAYNNSSIMDGHLKAASANGLSMFSDGFELGDTSRWTFSTP